jgi:predicted ABC-type ATPase
LSVPPFASLRAAAADERPVLIVLAGPNGAGKSTFFAEYLHGLGLLFVNADHIARMMRDAEPRLAPAQLERRAFEEAERLRADLLDLRFGFCTETVFSDPAGAKLDFIERARATGFVVLLVFIGLASPALSVARVATRVARGGHDVPNDKLFARFPRTLKNLSAAVGVVDQAFLLDNSTVSMPYRPVAMYADGRLAEEFPPLPRWTSGLPGLSLPRRRGR